jgi:translation initiation factor 1
MTIRKNENSRLVYSTEQGRMCPGCGRSIDKCICPRKKAMPPSDGIVRVGKETKGRKGKGMTLITGLALEPAELKILAKQLKQKCGTGGTVKNGIIEIQGDHRDLLMEELKKQGWKVKQSGG